MNSTRLASTQFGTRLYNFPDTKLRGYADCARRIHAKQSVTWGQSPLKIRFEYYSLKDSINLPAAEILA